MAVADNAATDEDSAITLAVLANDGDADGDSLSVVSVTQGANGAASINADVTVTYTPNGDFNGDDGFDYTISDGNGGIDTASVSVAVVAVNDPPVADDQSVNTNKNTAVDITLTGSNVDGNGGNAVAVVALNVKKGKGGNGGGGNGGGKGGGKPKK